MACGDFDTYAAFWKARQYMDAVICPYQDQLTMSLFALMVFGAIGSAFYARDNAIGIPLVLGYIFAGIFIAQAPPIFAQAAVVVIMLGLTIGGYLLVRRTGARVA